MQGTGVGGDSCLYKAFLILGFLGIIGSVVASALLFPDGSRMPLYIGGAGVAIFLALIMAYWIVQIFLKGYGGLQAPDLSARPDVKDTSVLQSWDKLFSAMIVEDVDSEKVQKAVRRGNFSLYIWFSWAVILGLCPIMIMLPYMFELVDWSYTRYGVGGYLGIVLLMIVLSAFLGDRGRQASEEVIFEPLGLKITALPDVSVTTGRPRVRGGSEIQGTRHGRQVLIRMGLGQVSTQVVYPAEFFEMEGISPKSGAPQAVLDAVRGLRAAKRWENLHIKGGSEGIVAIRKTRGQNMWLYDLWLIERIVNEMTTQKHGQ